MRKKKFNTERRETLDGELEALQEKINLYGIYITELRKQQAQLRRYYREGKPIRLNMADRKDWI